MTYDTNFAQNTIKAYFGQKDAMQCVLMRRLVEDLNLPPAIVVCDTGKSRALFSNESVILYRSIESKTQYTCIQFTFSLAFYIVHPQFVKKMALL
jgi:pantoate--beta-alanine ligase